MKPIYLDYMATTPVDPRVIEKMHACLGLEGSFGNPASASHLYGHSAMQLVQAARQQIADLIHSDPREIILTSGATESDNLAIKGVAQFYQRQGKHIITMATEHKAVLDTCRYLETLGFDVTYLKPELNGVLDLVKLKNALRDNTILVSIMHVNNETGVIQNIAEIGKICRERGIIFHTDAAQSAGKVAINVKEMQVDLVSLSGHKVYGPKGIGALYVRRNPPLHLTPLIHGGGHERGMRSGTLATHQIVGMGEAFAIAKSEMQNDCKKIAALRERLINGIQKLGGVHINGDVQQRISGCVNLRFDGVEGESLLLSLQGIAISTGSACNSASQDPSHVLNAMGLCRQDAYNSLRISFGRFTTEDEINFAVAHISEQVNKLRSMSPLWKG